MHVKIAFKVLWYMAFHTNVHHVHSCNREKGGGWRDKKRETERGPDAWINVAVRQMKVCHKDYVFDQITPQHTYTHTQRHKIIHTCVQISTESGTCIVDIYLCHTAAIIHKRKGGGGE